MPQSSGFDVKDLTTLAYFSVDANANGTLDESGSGWNGYESQDLVNLVNRSHAAGDRVVLTVTDFSQSSLDAITSDPKAGARLSAALISAVSAKNLDGVNFDFEGEGSGDQKGLTRLITQVSEALHAANPHWQVTMAVYASSAADPGGFYDIAALAPAVDGFFVMAYEMNNQRGVERHGTAGRRGIHRHRGAPAVHRGGAGPEGDTRGAVLRVRLADLERDAPAQPPAETRRSVTGSSPPRDIRPTGIRKRTARGPRTRWGPSGTRRSSTTRHPWP